MKNILTIVLFIVTTSGIAFAGIDPQTYFEIEVKARQMTLAGMDKRLACMKNGCPLAEQYAIDEEYRQKILNMYEEYGTTPSRLSAWYTHHAEETKNYLLTHPRLQLQFDDLDYSFETLSDAINTLLEAR
jgi:hypothetical protein